VNPKRMRGAGGLEVYLEGGTHLHGQGDLQGTVYENLDGLYHQLASAVALRVGQMSGEEARFLRKRLGLTQAQLGALGGKSSQVAAKWEKGTLPMPSAEASLLRLLWMNRFSPADMPLAVDIDRLASTAAAAGCYVFKYTDDGHWERALGTSVEQIHYSTAENARVVIDMARTSETAYTAPFGARI